ncbi:MAG: hypothetical protein AB7J19_07840 [Beijerinckiaceae bacterium]
MFSVYFRVLPFFLRILPFAMGCLALILAWSSWLAGSPPTWSVFGPRERLEVKVARIEEVPIGAGRIRYVPIVEVEFPTGAGRLTRVRGLVGNFDTGTQRGAQKAVARHPAGKIAKFRASNGIIYANRTDGYSLAHASFLSVMAVLLLIPGLLIMLPGTERMWRPRGLARRGG